MDKAQLQLTQEKLMLKAKLSPKLLRLDEPVDPDWLEAFEAERNIDLPWDYREIILNYGDGGYVPDVLSKRYWRPLEEMAEIAGPLDALFLPTAAEDVTRLPGQLPLMGHEDLCWSLITAGPWKGEVWTLGHFGVLRAPACSFAQWLELVLDGTLEPYLTYCLTGAQGRQAWVRPLPDLGNAAPIWAPGEDPVQRCARWLEDNRFVHQGPSSSWSDYLRGQISHTLHPLPQERDRQLAIRREAQKLPDWQWDTEWTKKWARIGQLIQVIRAAEEQGEAWAAQGPEEELYRQAAELLHAKRFQARGEGVRDLSFLEGLARLKELDLWDNDIEDLSPLATLTGLRELSLPYNLISDLSPLAGLDKLVQLKVYGNQITSLEPLRGLTNLNVLNLRGNPLEPGTLACLRKCRRLGMLDLAGTGLEDISDLEFCRAWNLDLYDNPDLTGLEVISTMKKLSCLYLDTAIAQRYDIPALAPQLTQHVELGGLSLYVWPEKYFD